jgi:hypothetical protein
MILHNLLLSSEEPGPTYLFRSQGKSLIFLCIEDEMKRLNDYCVLSDRAAAQELIKWEKRYTDDQEKVDDEDEEWPDAYFEYFGWTETQQTVVSGMILILLSAFVD